MPGLSYVRTSKFLMITLTPENVMYNFSGEFAAERTAGPD